jgi:hypothetical protein
LGMNVRLGSKCDVAPGNQERPDWLKADADEIF